MAPMLASDRCDLYRKHFGSLKYQAGNLPGQSLHHPSILGHGYHGLGMALYRT